MAETLKFSKHYNSDHKKLFDITTDFKNAQKLIVFKIDSKILKQTYEETVSEETYPISRLNFKISQKSIHKKTSPNKLETQIISGPLKGTTIKLIFEKIESKTKIDADIELKVGLKYFFLKNFIKKNFEKILVTNLNYANTLAILTQGQSWEESLTENGECLHISNENFPMIKLFGWYNGALADVFINEDYGKMPIDGQTVIDIGSNIGDSSIYFVSKGAKRVIALEPFKKNYDLAQKNIDENNLTDKIVLLHTGLSDTEKIMHIDPEQESRGGKLKEFENGIEIKTTTLENILKKFNVDTAILKMDCEGCEYLSILTSSKTTLQKFSHITMEYHKEPEKLIETLEKYNFDVNVVPYRKGFGLIFAVQKSNL